jgi:hypothetical protein
MSFVQRELDRIRVALVEGPRSDDERRQLYAAQQALSWALEPIGFKAPYATITGTPEEPEDCLENTHQLPS